jgi:hypothetical protein
MDHTNPELVIMEIPGDTAKEIVLSKNFIEWFRGFTDAEGCFTIRKTPNRRNSYQFNFAIGLHLADKKALEYIHSNLKIGQIWVDPKIPSAVLNISKQSELSFITSIFSYFPLNTTKFLDFLSFEQAFNIYIKDRSHSGRANIAHLIEKAKGSINTQRTNFDMPLNHFKITRNWLLGFVEGDGSFNCELRDKKLVFSIRQKRNKALLHAIKNFLGVVAASDMDEVNLPVNISENAIKIYSYDKDITGLIISNKDFIEFVLIPLFDGLIWHSKKYLDYIDWKAILDIKKLGLHLTPQGKVLIDRIISQMNNRRSSINSSSVDRSELLTEIREILKQPSNYGNKGGWKFNKTLNRRTHEGKPIKIVLIDASTNNILQSFLSIKNCGEYLGLNRNTTSSRASSGTQFTHEGRLVYLKRDTR